MLDAEALLDHEFLSSNCACHFLIGKLLQMWEDALQMNAGERKKNNTFQGSEAKTHWSLINMGRGKAWGRDSGYD